MQYEIYADEAWTHKSEECRYWCFYGGLFGETPELDRLETALRGVAERHSLPEVKWSKLTHVNEVAYRDFVDCVLDHIADRPIVFRQMLYDRALVRVPPLFEPPNSDLDVQFKLCYQFLKHTFGLKHLPPAGGTEQHTILVRLDTHSSQRHKVRLIEFAENLPSHLERHDLRVRVTFHDSRQFRRLQAVDLLIGAAGSHGNKMHKRRAPGGRGMTAKQRAKHDFAKHVYNRLREVDRVERGSGGFNWFESTGIDGDPANVLTHSVRIWKLKPQQFRVDKGWENDNLDRQGRYQGPKIDPIVREP